MAVGATLIRNVGLTVNHPDGGGAGVPGHVDVRGITNLTHQPSTQRADKTTFDLAGYNAQLVVGRGDVFTAQALVYEDEADGSRDQGQERCEALALLVGQAAIEEFVITRAGGGTITFNADVEVQILGGGVNDLSTWALTLTVQEAPVYA